MSARPPSVQIDKHGKYRPDPRSLTKSLRDLRPAVARSAEVRFALRAYAAYHRGDWAAFFSLVAGGECGYMEGCLLHKFFTSVRSRALRVLHASLNRGTSVPLRSLCGVLGTEGEELEQLCAHHGVNLQVEADGALSLLAFAQVLPRFRTIWLSFSFLSSSRLGCLSPGVMILVYRSCK